MISMRLVRRLRTTVPLVATGLVSTTLFTPPLLAGGFDDTPITPALVAQLQEEATHANPREQCFLYTQLVHVMAERAGKQIADGETEEAAASLKLVNQYAHMVQASLARDTKRLKNAEELMHHTTYRFAEYLHLASDENRTEVQATLKQLDEVNDDLLNQVFHH